MHECPQSSGRSTQSSIYISRLKTPHYTAVIAREGVIFDKENRAA
jgi:hypothetical protein